MFETKHAMIKPIFCFSFFFILYFSLNAQTPEYRWKRVSTEYGDIPLPGDGKIQVQCLVADFTKNGKDDFIIIDNTDNQPIVIYTNVGNTKWEVSIVEKRKISAGEAAAYFDIDNDGDLDIAVGSEETNQIWWWENPYPDIDTPRGWKRNYIKKDGEPLHNNMAFGDFDGDHQIELAFWNQGANSLFIAEKPENVEKADNWPLTCVYTYSTDGQMQQRDKNTEPNQLGTNYHGGMAVADINNDGTDDIVAGGMWFQYLNGTYISNPVDLSYSSAMIAAGQLIEGGRPEIVMVSGYGSGPLILYQYVDHVWIPKELDKTTKYAHTLQLIDFNKDGLLDIFSAEMKIKANKNPGIFILLNKGQGDFERINISNNFGSHNSGIGDLDGNGEFDIVVKPNTWDTPRIDLWLNQGLK